jgi:hypothetical protein
MACNPLPREIFDTVNAETAVVHFDDGRVRVVWRDPESGIVRKKRPTGLNLRFRERLVFARWLSDPRRRELRLPWVRGRFVLTDQEWNGGLVR